MSDEQNWFMAKIVGPKKEWREYKRRVKALPSPYVDAVEGIQRYVFHFGGTNDPSALLNDIIDLFERAAADGTPLRDIVGEDPVEFADALIRNYQDEGYVAREQNRLRASIDKAISAAAPGKTQEP